MNNPVSAKLVTIENVNNNVTLAALDNTAPIQTAKLTTGINANPIEFNPAIDGIKANTMNNIVHGPK